MASDLLSRHDDHLPKRQSRSPQRTETAHETGLAASGLPANDQAQAEAGGDGELALPIERTRSSRPRDPRQGRHARDACLSEGVRFSRSTRQWRECDGSLVCWAPVVAALGGMWSRLADPCRHALRVAQERSNATGAECVDTEDAVVGLLAERDGIAALALRNFGLARNVQ
jgi:hypothetical protein